MSEPLIKESQIQRLTQIFKYLKEFDQIRNPVVRDLRSQRSLLWFRDLPAHPAVEKGVVHEDAPKETEDEIAAPDELPFVLRVGRAAVTLCPLPPSSIADWLRPGWREFDGAAVALEERNIPRQDGTAEFETFDAVLERVAAFTVWKITRTRWIENERPARAALKLFEKIYEIWGQLEREGERLELILGDGHLSMPALGIQHPILLQRITLEFDAKVPQFVLRPATQPVELYQELRTVRVCSLLDEVGHDCVGEVTFEAVPAFDLSTPALEFQLHERTQTTEEMVADGSLPTHEELFGVADLFDGTMIALDGPVLLMSLGEGVPGHFHALFFRGSKAA